MTPVITPSTCLMQDALFTLKVRMGIISATTTKSVKVQRKKCVFDIFTVIIVTVVVWPFVLLRISSGTKTKSLTKNDLGACKIYK